MSADQEKYGPKKGLLPRSLNDMTSDEICKELQKANSEYLVIDYMGMTSSINVTYKNTLFILCCYQDAGAITWKATVSGESWYLFVKKVETFEDFLEVINKNNK